MSRKNEQEPALSRKEKRRAEMLSVAAEMFLEYGYDGTSTDMLVERLGGSKSTIYSYFGSKQEMFESIVLEVASEVFAALPEQPTDDQDLTKALVAFANKYLSIVLEPRTISICRAAVAEGRRFPEIGHYFLEMGPMRAAEQLAAWLCLHFPDGHLPQEDAVILAEQFSNVLKGHFIFRALAGDEVVLSDAREQRYIEIAVAQFVAGARACY